jgi:hypothetical protein
MSQVKAGVDLYYGYNTVIGEVDDFKFCGMKAVCAFNRAADLAEHQRDRRTSLEAVYPLTVGASYLVVGMGIWEIRPWDAAPDLSRADEDAAALRILELVISLSAI